MNSSERLMGEKAHTNSFIKYEKITEISSKIAMKLSAYHPHQLSFMDFISKYQDSGQVVPLQCEPLYSTPDHSQVLSPAQNDITH